MTSPDEEFEDFLRKRRPLFGRDEELEPPLELDRVVLRQAREAIESARPQRVFRAPSWGMPVALAATLMIAFTIILRVGTHDAAKKPEVAIQQVSRQIEMPAAAPPPPVLAREAAPPQVPAREVDSGAVVVDLGAAGARVDAEAPSAADARARRLEKLADTTQPARNFASDAEAARFSQPMGGGRATASAPHANAGVAVDDQRADASAAGELHAAPAAAPAAAPPGYHHDAKTWLAEIERLRAAGETSRADAELAEFKREHRAYAVAPDR